MDNGETLDLNSNFLEKMRASIRVPEVWGRFTLYNGQFYTLGRRNGPAMVKMYLEGKIPNGTRRHIAREIIPSEINITVFPNHLASASMFLLSSKDGDDFVRILFLPDTDRGSSGPPEIKYLRVTLNQILAKFEEPETVGKPIILNKPHGDKLEEESSDEDTGEAEKDAIEDRQELSADE